MDGYEIRKPNLFHKMSSCFLAALFKCVNKGLYCIFLIFSIETHQKTLTTLASARSYGAPAFRSLAFAHELFDRLEPGWTFAGHLEKRTRTAFPILLSCRFLLSTACIKDSTSRLTGNHFFFI